MTKGWLQAAEVALLTRNIIIDTFEDARRDPAVGGHVMVYRTQIPQYIVGVEFKGLGQLGSLGRYPLHFHMCGRSVPASDSPFRLTWVHVVFFVPPQMVPRGFLRYTWFLSFLFHLFHVTSYRC